MQMQSQCVNGVLRLQALRQGQGALVGTNSARTRRSASLRSSSAAALAGWGAGLGAAWAAGAALRGPPECTSSAAAPAAEEVGSLPDSKPSRLLGFSPTASVRLVCLKSLQAALYHRIISLVLVVCTEVGTTMHIADASV